MGEHEEHIVFEMGYNKGFKDGIKGSIPKADYETRLKADMTAMLTEIQLEIEKIKPLEPTDDEDWQYGCFHGLELMQDKCLRLIQEKINTLRGDVNERK